MSVLLHLFAYVKEEKDSLFCALPLPPISLTQHLPDFRTDCVSICGILKLIFPFLPLSHDDFSPVLGTGVNLQSSLLCTTELVSTGDLNFFHTPSCPCPPLFPLSCHGDLRLSRGPGSASSQLSAMGVTSVCTSWVREVAM